MNTLDKLSELSRERKQSTGSVRGTAYLKLSAALIEAWPDIEKALRAIIEAQSHSTAHGMAGVLRGAINPLLEDK